MGSSHTATGRRFHVDPLSAGVVEVSGEQAHHAVHVLRLAVGSAVTLFDGAGRVAEGTIVSTGRSKLTVSVEHVGPMLPRREPVIELAFAAAKGKRVDWLLEKASELGVGRLQPVVFARSVAGRMDLSAGKRRRWLSHCISAARQCGLNFLPDLRQPLTVAHYLAGCDGAIRLVGEVAEAAHPLPAALADWSAGQTIAILVGPEGDLTDEERAAASRANFRPVHLGHTTLRVETAALALTAATLATCDHRDT